VGAKRLLNQVKANRVNIVNYHIKKNKITNPSVIKHHRTESIKLTSKIKIKKVKLPAKPKVKAPKKEGTYNTTLIIDGSGNNKYIKWTTIKDFNKQLRKIKDVYEFTKIGKTTTHTYTEYLTPEFIKVSKDYGIKL